MSFCEFQHWGKKLEDMSFYCMVPLGLYFGIVQYKGYIKAAGGVLPVMPPLFKPADDGFIQIDESSWFCSHGVSEFLVTNQETEL